MIEKIKNIFLKEPKPFTTKRDLKTGLIKKFFFIGLAGLILFLLMIPGSKKNQDENSFKITEDKSPNESGLPGSDSPGSDSFGSDPEIEAMNQKTLETLSGNNGSRKKSKILDYLYLGKKGSGNRIGQNKKDSSMIIQREDFKNALPISSRVLLTLSRELKIDGSTEIPVQAFVTNDVYYRENLVIPKGSSFFGHAGFSESQRVQIKWHMVQFFPIGTQKKVEALSLGLDGRLGIPGKLSGNFSKNLVGSGLSKVIGAYARGSMETSVFGQNKGGHKNGLRGAAAQAAKDYGENFSQDMQKKVRWITLPPDTKLYALITKPFPLGGISYE